MLTTNQALTDLGKCETLDEMLQKIRSTWDTKNCKPTDFQKGSLIAGLRTAINLLGLKTPDEIKAQANTTQGGALGKRKRIVR